MKSKLRFRAFVNGKMMYQENQYLSSFLRRVYRELDITHPSYLDYDIEDLLMQSTGRKDKNGKFIYEGDIVTVDGKMPREIQWCNLNAKYISRVEPGVTFSQDWNYGEHRIEVIGNIKEVR